MFDNTALSKKKVKFHVLIWKNLALNTEKPSKNTIFQFQTWVLTAEINKIKIDFLSKLTLLACRSIYKLVDCFHSYLHNIYKWNFLRLNIISKVRTFWKGHKNLKQSSTWSDIFRFSKKATKFETTSHMIWRLISTCQISWEIVSNFCDLFRMSELYCSTLT